MREIINDKIIEIQEEYKIQVNLRPVNLLIADYILKGEIDNIFKKGKDRIRIVMDLTEIEPFCYIYDEETPVAFYNKEQVEHIEVYSMDLKIHDRLANLFKEKDLKAIEGRLYSWFGENDLIEQAKISEEDLYERVRDNRVSDYLYVGDEILVFYDLVKECEKALKEKQTLLITIIEGILEEFEKEVKETTEKLMRGLI